MQRLIVASKRAWKSVDCDDGPSELASGLFVISAPLLASR